MRVKDRQRMSRKKKQFLIVINQELLFLEMFSTQSICITNKPYETSLKKTLKKIVGS